MRLPAARPINSPSGGHRSLIRHFLLLAGLPFCRRTPVVSVVEAMIKKGPDYCPQVRLGFLHYVKAVMPGGHRFDDDGNIVLLVR